MVPPRLGAESPTSSLGDYSSRSASSALSDEGPSEAAGTPLTGSMATPRRSLWDDTLGDGRSLNGVPCVFHQSSVQILRFMHTPICIHVCFAYTDTSVFPDIFLSTYVHIHLNRCQR